MTQSISSKFFLPFLFGASLFGLVLVPILLLQPNLQIDPSYIRRPLVGTIYSVICVLGVVAVFYPGKCRMIFQNPRSNQNSENPTNLEDQLKGHHPNCEKFSSNRITIRGSVFCAACSGLLFGATIAMAGITLFSLNFFDFQTGELWILITGEIMMLAGLVQIKLRDYAKMAANTLFVIGSCISMITTDLVGQSLLIDSYVLGLIVFMLWFRILLSEWNNKKTCLECGRCFRTSKDVHYVASDQKFHQAQ